MNAWGFLNSLSDEDKNFLKTQQVDSVKSAQNWIDFFNNCLDFDKIGDKERKKNGWLAVIVAVPALGSGFMVFSMLGNLSAKSAFLTFFIPFLLIFLLTVFLIIFFANKYSKLAHFNLVCNEMIRQQVLPVLMLLRADSKSSQPVKLRLDLRGFSTADKLVSSDPTYQNSSGYNVTVSRYKDNWMDGETMLTDGTQIVWNALDFYKQTVKIKYKRKGKTKTKTKQKGNGLISMQIGMDRDIYTLPERLKDKTESDKITTKKEGNHDWMKIRQKSEYGEGCFHIKNFADAIAKAYMRATPVKGAN